MSAAPQIDPKEAARAEITKMIRENINAAIDEMHAKGRAGAYDNDERPFGLPKLKAQWMFDLYDPLKGKGIRVAQYWKVLMISQGALGTARPPEEVAKGLEEKGLVDPEVTKAFEARKQKALSEQTSQDGGFLVPLEFSAEFIQLLRPLTVCRESGIRVVPMSGQSLVVNRQNTPGTATYEGELMAVLASQQTFGQLRLLARKLMALTPVSNDLIRDAGPLVDMIIRDDLAAITALRMDLAGLRGDGFQETPTGLLNQVDSANKFPATQAGSTATVQEMANDIEKAIELVKSANVPFTLADLGWVMHPRTERWLKAVANTQGTFPFRDEVRQGMLAGAKIRTTTQIPTNLGGGANESEIYIGAWPHYYLGENMALAIEVFPNGAYTDASGNNVMGINTDQTVIRAIMRHDFKLRYTKAFSIIQTVKWGA